MGHTHFKRGLKERKVGNGTHRFQMQHLEREKAPHIKQKASDKMYA